MGKLRGSVLVLVLLSLLASPARAGGWWSSIGLEGQSVGIGETFSLRVSEVMFDSIEEADASRHQTFYAYLVKEFDEEALDDAMTRDSPGDWWIPLTQPIRVGTVELFDWDANLAKARVRLHIPQAAPGSYSLMLCNEGCEVALGNLVPSEVDVTTDALAAKTNRRLLETEADLTLALQRSHSDLRETRTKLRRALSDDAEQTEQIRALGRQLTEANTPEPPPWMAYAGWFIGGAAITLLLLISRRRSRSETDPLIERIPDDARELTKVP